MTRMSVSVFSSCTVSRADAARAAHQQQGAATSGDGFVHIKAVKQGFPRGKRGQRQRGGLGESSVRGLRATMRSSTACIWAYEPGRLITPA